MKETSLNIQCCCVFQQVRSSFSATVFIISFLLPGFSRTGCSFASFLRWTSQSLTFGIWGGNWSAWYRLFPVGGSYEQGCQEHACMCNFVYKWFMPLGSVPKSGIAESCVSLYEKMPVFQGGLTRPRAARLPASLVGRPPSSEFRLWDGGGSSPRFKLAFP